MNDYKVKHEKIGRWIVMFRIHEPVLPYVIANPKTNKLEVNKWDSQHKE